MTAFCCWESCDQEPLYCGGHARELVAPELDAMRARVAELERNYAEQVELVCHLSAERDRLRAALEAAPEPLEGFRDHHEILTFPLDARYAHWHNTTRREALDG